MESSSSTAVKSVPEAPVEPQIGNGAELARRETGALARIDGEQRPAKRGAESPGAETWLIALFFGVVYGVVGYFMLTDARIVNFDSLQLLNNAYTAWWNSPPKLAALPLDVAPLDSIVYLPFALIKPFATSLVAIPVITAIAAGLLMALLNSTMARCEFPAWLRYGFLVLFGLNPMFVFYAGNGDPTVLGMMFAGVALLSLISWALSAETRYLALGGLAIGIAVMFDYGYFLWAIGMTFAIMFVGGEESNSDDRRRASLFVFLTPTIYVLSLWIVLNTLLIGSPFGWLSPESGMIQANTTGALDAITASFGGTMSDLGRVVFGVAPLAFVTALLLLFAGIAKRSSLAWGLLTVLILAAAVPTIRALVGDQANLMDLSAGLPIALVAFAGAAWVHRVEEGWRAGVAVIMAIGLIAAIPLGWIAMREYRFQDQAQAFTRWVEDRESQEGTPSLGQYTVGIDPEVAMASYINNRLPQVESSILVDENFSYGPMILSGRPTLFADRADQGEGKWEEKLNQPFGVVGYMLITTSRGGDQLRKRYPEAISGGELGMTPIFRTDRYVLVQVARTQPPAERVAKPGEVVPNPAPSPFTPQRPLDPSNPDESVAIPGSAPPTTVPAPEATAPGSVSGNPGSPTAPQIEGE
jgi:hypothetical protein